MPTINNHDIKLYYEVVGKGYPIIFHNGYGKSSKPHDPNQYTEPRRTSDTIKLMDHLGIKKAVAFGNSMGGRMVYAF